MIYLLSMYSLLLLALCLSREAVHRLLITLITIIFLIWDFLSPDPDSVGSLWYAWCMTGEFVIISICYMINKPLSMCIARLSMLAIAANLLSLYDFVNDGDIFYNGYPYVIKTIQLLQVAVLYLPIIYKQRSNDGRFIKLCSHRGSPSRH